GLSARLRGMSNASQVGSGAPVPAKALQQAVQDLQTTEPGPGLARTALMAVLTLGGAWLALTAPTRAGLVLGAVFAGISFASWLITTHDALHHTLTGWVWFDEVVPRL